MNENGVEKIGDGDDDVDAEEEDKEEDDERMGILLGYFYKHLIEFDEN